MEARDFVEGLVGAGLTQTQIADRCGIPQPTISKVARGDVKDVLSANYRRLQALYCEVMGFPPPAPLPSPPAANDTQPGALGEPQAERA